MQNKSSQPNSPAYEIFVTITLGLLIGLMTTLFIKLLALVEIKQFELNLETWPPHILMMPIVLLFLYILKRRSLFFPRKISDMVHAKSDTSNHWSPFMAPYHFFGTLVSHMTGASVGREGAVVLMSAGIVRAFRVSWLYWGPVAAGCGFAAIIGNYWVGVIFVMELFTTNVKQKIFTFVSSAIAVLLMQTLQVKHLFENLHLQVENTFFEKLFFILCLGILSGYIMRIYKSSYFYFSDFFKKKSVVFQIILTLALMFFLMRPEFRHFQSLGLQQIENIFSEKAVFSDSLLKLFVTLISLICGFWGGEFIPLIYSGLHFGNSLAQALNFNVLAGTCLGCFLFFTGGTRLKWTSYFLIISLVGWSWFIWVFVLVNVTIRFSGEKSLYRDEH
jgi:H+/Cl- antiporter ClcA